MTVTEVDRSWPTQVDAVAIAPQSFAVVDQVRFDTFPLIAKLTRWGIDAHMGILFGLPNQLLLAAFGLGLCLMIVLGYRMWWSRRPAAGAASGADAGRRLAGAFPAGACLHAAGSSGAGLLPAGNGREPRGVAAGGRMALARPAAKPPGRNAGSARRAEVRKFRTAVATVAVAVGCVMGRAILGGTVEQFQLPIGDWSAQMVIMQSLMVLLYTLVFTLLLSIPLWYFFLGKKRGGEVRHACGHAGYLGMGLKHVSAHQRVISTERKRTMAFEQRRDKAITVWKLNRKESEHSLENTSHIRGASAPF